MITNSMLKVFPTSFLLAQDLFWLCILRNQRVKRDRYLTAGRYWAFSSSSASIRHEERSTDNSEQCEVITRGSYCKGPKNSIKALFYPHLILAMQKPPSQPISSEYGHNPIHTLNEGASGEHT